MASETSAFIKFLQLVGKLKSTIKTQEVLSTTQSAVHPLVSSSAGKDDIKARLKANIPRTGWVLRGIKNPETVAGHMYRMGIMALLIPESSGLDLNKCLKLALVHDISECIVGDLTPFCGVTPDEKHRREVEAIQELARLAGEAGPTLSSIYHEYAAQETAEAKLVKELDRLDMVIQAFEYELQEATPRRLQEFFDSTVDKFQHPWTKKIIRELYQQRSYSSQPNQNV